MNLPILLSYLNLNAILKHKRFIYKKIQNLNTVINWDYNKFHHLPTPNPSWNNLTKSSNSTTKFLNRSLPSSLPGSVNTKLMPRKLIFPPKWMKPNAINFLNNFYRQVSINKPSILFISSSLLEVNCSEDNWNHTLWGTKLAVSKHFKSSIFWHLSLWKTSKQLIRKIGCQLYNQFLIHLETWLLQVFSTVKLYFTRTKTNKYSKYQSMKTALSPSS